MSVKPRLGRFTLRNTISDKKIDATEVRILPEFTITILSSGFFCAEQASLKTCEVLSNELEKSFDAASSEDKGCGIIRRALVRGNDLLNEYAKSSGLHMQSMAILSVWTNFGPVFVTGVGLSRAYLVNKCGIKLVQTEDSVARKMLNTGQISTEEYSNHRLREACSRGFFAHQLDFRDGPEVTILRPESPDRLVLCKHSVWRHISDQAIAETAQCINDPQECAKALCVLARESGAMGDISCIIVRAE